jgi:hypothetical protein
LITTTTTALPQVKNAVRQIPAHDVVWTQNHLGPWVYRFKILGIAKEGVPGDFIDSLSLLWKKSGNNKTIPTVLLAKRPVNPYFADVMALALHSGYRITFHQGSVFILSGSKRFHIPEPTSFGLGWQPSAPSWVIPAWTQLTSIGQINWREQTVSVPANTPGIVFPGMLVQLGPGDYQVAATLSYPSLLWTHAHTLGTLLIDHHRKAIEEGDKIVRINISLAQSQILTLSLTSDGSSSFMIHDFYVKRLGGS